MRSRHQNSVVARLFGRGLSQVTIRRNRFRKLFVAAVLAGMAGGAFLHEAPAGDLFAKLRAHNNSKAETLTLEQLASLVDNLDKELQRQGRVTVKQPDVWGQNRLTEVRGKYDEIIKKDLDKFSLILSGYKSELDNAALAYEMRIRNTLVRNANGVLTNPLNDTPKLTTTDVNVIVSNPSNGTFSGTNSNLPNFAFTKDNSNLTLANTNTANGIGLEPTIYIDEKSRYLQHIMQKLRNNMGDDKTDMPGYGLYLVRMPISILPGSNTMRDNGAVVTAEIKHNLTGDLMVTSLRKAILRETVFNLFVNLNSVKDKTADDLKDNSVIPVIHTGSAMTATIGSGGFGGSSLSPFKKFQDEIEKLQSNTEQVKTMGKELSQAMTQRTIAQLPTTLESLRNNQLNKFELQRGFAFSTENLRETMKDYDELNKKQQEMIRSQIKKNEQVSKNLEKKINDINEELKQVAKVRDNYWKEDINSFYVSPDDLRFLKREWDSMSQQNSYNEADLYLWLNQKIADSESWLYKALKNPATGHRIKAACLKIQHEYAEAQIGVSTSGKLRLDNAREELFTSILETINNNDQSNSNVLNFFIDSDSSVATKKGEEDSSKLQVRNQFTFVYCYVLFSAIVKEQLVKDMKIVAERKGVLIDDTDLQNMNIIDPDDLTKSHFTDYIKAKWPIQVFSLDPEVDQQNEADALSRRTDMQVALAQAMATGAVELTQALQYSRRIEQQFATIGLNRTAVGFSAAATTFGWKFYPRLQTPPPQSNPERVLSTIFQGSPSRRYDMSHRQMEPGTRECVALVVAPNFVPSIRMTTTTNWFDLTPIKHHGDERILNTDMIRMGRQIQMARNAFQRLCDDGNYRPGDLERLQDRITQLENMLPTQTMDVQLPYEGDWYGMELFTSDGARLAPRLFMWYGEPAKPSTGVNKVDGQDKKTFEGVEQSVFIIGQGFSVTESKVIVGGIALPETDYQLISRNVMRVRIPKDAGIVDYGTKKVIDVHVATPNGVSNHLYIELPKEPEAPKIVEKIVTNTEYVNVQTPVMYLTPESRKVEVAYGRSKAGEKFGFVRQGKQFVIDVGNHGVKNGQNIKLQIDFSGKDGESLGPVTFQELIVQDGKIILSASDVEKLTENLKIYKFEKSLNPELTDLSVIYTTSGKFTVITGDKKSFAVDPEFTLSVRKIQPSRLEWKDTVLNKPTNSAPAPGASELPPTPALGGNRSQAVDRSKLETTPPPPPVSIEPAKPSDDRPELKVDMGSRRVPDLQALSDPSLEKQSYERTITAAGRKSNPSQSLTRAIQVRPEPVATPPQFQRVAPSPRANTGQPEKVYSESLKNASKSTGIPLPKR